MITLTPKLTPENEEHYRYVIRDGGSLSCAVAQTLFDEIDRLREERTVAFGGTPFEREILIRSVARAIQGCHAEPTMLSQAVQEIDRLRALLRERDES